MMEREGREKEQANLKKTAFSSFHRNLVKEFVTDQLVSSSSLNLSHRLIHYVNESVISPP